MGDVNTIPRRIDGVEGAAGQVILSGGPDTLETWGGTGVGSDPVYAAASGGATVVRKTADESIVNEGVLQNDDELLFAVAANEEWAFEVFLSVVSPAAADFKCSITCPAAPDHILFEYIGMDPTDALIHMKRNTGGDALTMRTQGGIEIVYFRGLFRNGANAGSIRLQWCQNVADAGNTIVRQGSCIIAHKIN
ncbi:hypothetical protein ES703_67287 [subsurface metagenome]